MIVEKKIAGKYQQTKMNRWMNCDNMWNPKC